MKKKIAKKLSLNKETLRHLAERGLRDAVGGLPTDFCSQDLCPTNADTCSDSCPSATRC